MPTRALLSVLPPPHAAIIEHALPPSITTHIGLELVNKVLHMFRSREEAVAFVEAFSAISAKAGAGTYHMRDCDIKVGVQGVGRAWLLLKPASTVEMRSVSHEGLRAHCILFLALCPPCTFSVPAQADQGIIKCAMGAIVQLSVRVVQRAEKAKACAHGLSVDGYHLCPASPPGLASWSHPSCHHHHRSKQAGAVSARPFTLKIKRGPKKGALGFTAKFNSAAVVVESVLPAGEN